MKFFQLTLIMCVFGSNLNIFESLIVKNYPVFLYDLIAKTIFHMIQNINAPNEKTRAAGIPNSEIQLRKKLLIPKHTPDKKLGITRNVLSYSSVFLVTVPMITVLLQCASTSELSFSGILASPLSIALSSNIHLRKFAKSLDDLPCQLFRSNIGLSFSISLVSNEANEAIL